MISQLTLKFGPSAAQPPLNISGQQVTVFVGPNNSGKSKLLREIHQRATTFDPKPSDKILDSISKRAFSEEEVVNAVGKCQLIPLKEEPIGHDDLIISGSPLHKANAHRFRVNRSHLIREATQGTSFAGDQVFKAFISFFTTWLGGEQRLELTKAMDAGDFQNSRTNLFQELFQNDELRVKVRELVKEAIGKYLVLDATKPGKLRLRLSERAPTSPTEEKNWDKESIEFHRQAILLEDASDGVKAFIGIIVTILAGNPKLALIDEPEAFLHPALSNLLGKSLCSFAKGSNRQLFVATHSSSFLLGCLQSGASINIVRLNYNFGNPTARVLDSQTINKLTRHPLLRSANVLSGLFYDSVIVTEGDSDRAFYQEVNERLLTKKDPRGISSCLFLNAQNKQTVWEIVAPLRKLGIPALGIVDIDAFKEGGTVWSRLLSGAFIPEPSHNTYSLERKNAAEFFKPGDNWTTASGISSLPEAERASVEDFLNRLLEYGVLVVPGGELESWLKHLGVSGSKSGKNKWLIQVFDRMGDQPDSPGYVTPSDGDVWDFLGRAKHWLTSSSRKGIPSC